MLEEGLETAGVSLEYGLVALVLAFAIPLRLDLLSGIGVDYPDAKPDCAQVAAAFVACGLDQQHKAVL